VDNDPDQALVARYRDGDRSALAELVRRYQRPIYNAAFWILRRPEDASDVTQDVFLAVASRIDEYDPRFKFFSWIYRIAVNASLNLLRRDGHEEALDDDAEFAADDSVDPQWQASAAQTARRIRSALLTMSTNDRAVLALRHFSECSYQEIAQILSIDEKTVKSRLFEARHRLRELLQDLHA
jgi:RNA polymerase sigma-70 factor, ECF subfamily